VAPLHEVLVVSTHIKPTPIAEVGDLEQALGFTMPQGWIDIVTTFGEGTYCDLFRIYPPSKILSDLQWHREQWEETFEFFEASAGLITRRQLRLSVPIGDTIDGDELLYNPADPAHVLLLPRHSDVITPLRADLEDLPAWNSPKSRRLTFQPWENQSYLDFRATRFELASGQMRAEIESLWGGLDVIYENSDDWSWGFVGFAPDIGARIQVLEDEDVTRTVGYTTHSGSGQRWLWLNVVCDAEQVDAIARFVRGLRERGLAEFEDQSQ
jgi:hypothetical protein